MKGFLMAGVALFALTGCAALDGGDAPAPGAALYRVAERLAANGDTATAAALYRSAIAIGNNTPEVRRGYGNALLAIGEPRQAIEQFEAALTQAKDARSYNGLGVAYDMLGEHGRAQEMFRAGLALAPDNPGLMHNYGLSLAAAAPAGDTTATPAPAATPEAMPRDAVSPRTAETADAPPLSASPNPAPKAVSSRPVAVEAIPPAAAEPVAAATPVPRLHVPAADVEVPAPAPLTEPLPPSDDDVAGAPRANEIVPLDRPAVATPLRDGYFQLRLAGYATRERAAAARREIERRSPELQDAVRVVVERGSIAPGARVRYTLVSAPLPSLRAAETACGTLAMQGVACRPEPAASPLILRS